MPAALDRLRLTVLRLLLAAVVCGVALPLPAALASPATAAEAAPAEAPVVLVGAPGLRWDDLSAERTPYLWEQAGASSIGTMVVRTVRAWTCPIDGWLTVSSGRRSVAPLPDGTVTEQSCQPPAEPERSGASAARIPGYDTLLAFNDRQRYDAELGTLAATLEAAGTCATAVGPGAALALADRTGTVARYLPDPATLTADSYAGCRLTVVDLGSVTEPESDEDGVWAGAPATPRAEQVAALDRRFGALVEGIPAGATVLVAALADSELFPHLSLAMARGPAAAGTGDYTAAWLRSPSTRRPSLVQLTDVTPTVLAVLGVDPPESAVGSAWRRGGDRPDDTAEAVSSLVDLDDAAQVVRYVVPPFYALLVVAQFLLYGAAAVALRRQWGGPGRRLRMLRLTRRTALVFAAVPVSTFLANLVPWWRAGASDLALIGCVVGAVALVTLAAQGGPWRRWTLGPPGAVAAVTAVALGLDVVTGSTLQMSSLMGYSPVVGGRFYGFGNVAFALFATGAVLGVVAFGEPLVRRGRAGLAVGLAALTGIVAVVLDGLPRWGSDFGGVLALVSGFAVLVLRLAGLRLSVRRFLAILVAAVFTISVIAVSDWLRPPAERAHLGRFVQQVLDGEAPAVIGRKAQANLDILMTNGGFSLLVPVGFLFVAFVLMRPVTWRAAALERAYDRAPTLRPGVLALVVTLIVGFAVNDSGIAIPAVGLTLAIPFLLAVSVTALERDEVEARPADAPPSTSAEPSRPGATRA